MSEEIIVPFADTLASAPTATHCRSTLILASVQAIRKHGRFEDYMRAIDPSALGTIESVVAAMWLSIDVGVAHYSACDALGLSPQEQLDIGGEVALRVQQSLLGTMIKAAKASGTLSAWTALARFGFVYDHSFRGGGAQVVKLGPKDARVDVVGLPMARIPYFRTAYRGFIRAGMGLFTEKVYVSDRTKPDAGTSLWFHISWV